MACHGTFKLNHGLDVGPVPPNSLYRNSSRNQLWVVLKLNPTITACLIPYITEEGNSITSKKSNNFWI